jgi:hypothetical protein
MSSTLPHRSHIKMAHPLASSCRFQRKLYLRLLQKSYRKPTHQDLPRTKRRDRVLKAGNFLFTSPLSADVTFAQVATLVAFRPRLSSPFKGGGSAMRNATRTMLFMFLLISFLALPRHGFAQAGQSNTGSSNRANCDRLIPVNRSITHLSREL